MAGYKRATRRTLRERLYEVGARLDAYREQSRNRLTDAQIFDVMTAGADSMEEAFALPKNRLSPAKKEKVTWLLIQMMGYLADAGRERGAVAAARRKQRISFAYGRLGEALRTL